MHKGSARCRANKAYTAFHGGKGAVRHGCRNKDTPSFCTRQSHQSVLKGIGIINQKFVSKTYFFYKLRAGSVTCPQSVEKSQAEMLGFFIDMWYNKYGDERC